MTYGFIRVLGPHRGHGQIHQPALLHFPVRVPEHISPRRKAAGATGAAVAAGAAGAARTFSSTSARAHKSSAKSAGKAVAGISAKASRVICPHRGHGQIHKPALLHFPAREPEHGSPQRQPKVRRGQRGRQVRRGQREHVSHQRRQQVRWGQRGHYKKCSLGT